MLQIVKTEKETVKTNYEEIKYFKVNVSGDEIDRNPDIVRLVSKGGRYLEYIRKEI